MVLSGNHSETVHTVIHRITAIQESLKITHNKAASDILSLAAL